MDHTQCLRGASEEFIRESTLLRSESSQLKAELCLGFGSVFYWQLFTKGWNIYYLGRGFLWEQGFSAFSPLLGQGFRPSLSWACGLDLASCGFVPGLLPGQIANFPNNGP